MGDMAPALLVVPAVVVRIAIRLASHGSGDEIVCTDRIVVGIHRTCGVLALPRESPASLLTLILRIRQVAHPIRLPGPRAMVQFEHGD
jgi:hypothetical protein